MLCFNAIGSALTCWWRITCSEWVSNEAGVTRALRPVLGHAARGTGAAHARARVHALVADTRQLLRTVGVDGALRLALDVGVALQPGVAAAAGPHPAGPGAGGARALSVDATWRGPARVYDLWGRGGGGGAVAAREGVPDVSLVTDAQGHVVADTAVCVDAAEAGTRVLTLSVDTGAVLGTLRVDHALGPAVGRRPDHVGEASAVARATQVAGRVGVGPAGIRVTWVLHNDGGHGYNNMLTVKVYSNSQMIHHS